MDLSRLPDVSGHLVTADNPARTDLPGMDHVRCAALHNYLLHYGWIASGLPPERLPGNSKNFFTVYGAEAEALRPRLHPSVVAFLEKAMFPPVEGVPYETRPSFFWWTEGIPYPSDLFERAQVAESFEEPEEDILCLYCPNISLGGEGGGGLLYHQGYHLAAFFMHMDDHDFAFPLQAHRELWHPLETVLSNWIHLVHIGKIAASPIGTASLFGSEKGEPWEWRPYSEAQVVACVEAWDRLCGAVEARRTLLPSAPPIATSAQELAPLVAPAILDDAMVPEHCFARDFLARARRPRFRYVAPGLLLPPADAAEFAANQPFTRLPRQDPNVIPPVCLFSTLPGEPQADFNLKTIPFSTDEFLPAGLRRSALATRTGTETETETQTQNNRWSARFYGQVARFFGQESGSAAQAGNVPPAQIKVQVPVGLYSEGVDRGGYDNSEEGFHLLLPYDFKYTGGEPEEADAGVRKSDGSRFDFYYTTELFQHGYKPFGGDYYRPQRLERLFDHWRKLVVDGVWSVGPEGVEGTIEKFKEAGSRRWRDYVIPPSW